MKISDRRCLLYPLLGVILTLLVTACANVGNPSGGPRDEEPPRLIRATPPNGSLDVSKPQMTLQFNELVNVKDAFSTVVLSPSGKPPRITSQGKRVIIKFDSLAPNTTYTVDFADAIEDNNEGNKLQNFAYTFSTGPTLDTLRIAGRVLGARDMEPQVGMLVGVYADTADSAFMTLPMLRVAKTDDRGRFIVRGLAPGKYRVFALNDRDADFRYSSDEEDLAFYDSIVVPTTERVEAFDTVYNTLTGAVDTVTSRVRTRYLPNDVLLRTFNSGKRPQFVSRYERIDSTRLFLKLNMPEKRLPSFTFLDLPDMPAPVLESPLTNDSITMWLSPEMSRRDSLSLVVGYTRLERGKEPLAVLDTLKFIKKKLPKPKKGKKSKVSRADSLARISFDFKPLVAGQLEVYDKFGIEMPVPLARLDTTAIHLSVYRDSVWTPLSKGVGIARPDSLSPRLLNLDYNWDYATKYKLEVDTLAATDIYGRTSRPLSTEFTTRGAGDYCTLALVISGLEPDVPAFVELLNTSDKPVRTAVVERNRAFFPFLQPGKYYARVIEDLNGNGEYDTGDYESLRQPELAYYYPKVLNIKKNWDKEEMWDLWATAVDAMKPLQITKNKPKTGKQGRKQRKETPEDEDEDEPFDPTKNPFE